MFCVSINHFLNLKVKSIEKQAVQGIKIYCSSNFSPDCSGKIIGGKKENTFPFRNNQELAAHDICDHFNKNCSKQLKFSKISIFISNMVKFWHFRVSDITCKLQNEK